MKEELLKIKNLKTIYKPTNHVVEAVNYLDIDLYKGESLGLVGEAGAGKTTTALSILGLLPKKVGFVESGEIIFDGENLLEKNDDYLRMLRGTRISMIFQDPMTSLNPVIPVGKQIFEVLEFHKKEEGFSDLTSEDMELKVDNILSMVGLDPNRKTDYPHQLSGGMKQRIVIAMALIGNPELLIADEPTSALDVTIQAQILNLMTDLKKELGTSMIMITHDLGVVAETCDTVAIMYSGEIIEYGTVKDVFTGDRHHPYTVGLMNSIPNIHKDIKRLTTIPGSMPDPMCLPEGCKFRERCTRADERCHSVSPSYYVKGSHKIKCHQFFVEV